MSDESTTVTVPRGIRGEHLLINSLQELMESVNSELVVLLRELDENSTEVEVWHEVRYAQGRSAGITEAVALVAKMMGKGATE